MSEAPRRGVGFLAENGDIEFNNDGDFTDAGEVEDSSVSSIYHTFTESGYRTIRARIKDNDGQFTDILQEIFVPEE